MIFTSLLAPLAFANPPTQARNFAPLLQRLDVCSTSWREVVQRQLKAWHGGNSGDKVEYVTGWVSKGSRTVRVTLWDWQTDDAIGMAIADHRGLWGVKGELVDVEPVTLVDDCDQPTSDPIFALFVTTVENPKGFLSVIR
ncbi:MAG: hypothetical protein AAGA48_04785 [Myxococcota bacterium]